MNILILARSTLLGALGLAVAAIAAPAQAGIATTGAVLLDPFDPVPEIQFHHFGGYGCGYDCGGYRSCDDVCGGGSRGCYDGCHRRYRRHDCDDGCRRVVRDDCDHDCHDDHDGRDGHDGRDDGPPAPPCQSDHCYNAEHYERRWRDGDKIGQEWMDRGTRERTQKDDHDSGWYGRGDPIWHDGDDDPPPPPPPPPPPADDHHDHHDHH